MPAIRRTPSSTSVDGNQLGKDGKNVGNDQGSSSTTGALKRTGSSSKQVSTHGPGLGRRPMANFLAPLSQSTLSFTSKKALPPTPDKKRKSGDAPDTATAPLSPPATPSFARKAKAVESDVIKSGSSAANASPSVPSGYKPLGDDENDAMVANLKGVDMLQDDGSESDADEAEQSSPLHPHRSSGVRARKAMLRATDEINKARTATPAPVAKGGKGKGKVPASMEFGAKLDPKDKKWQAIYAKTSEAMGGDDCPPVHCTPKSHTRVHRE